MKTAREYYNERLKEDSTIGTIQLMEEYLEQSKCELPSDEDIQVYINKQPYYGHCTSEFVEGIEQGARWMRDQIQPPNQEEQP